MIIGLIRLKLKRDAVTVMYNQHIGRLDMQQRP